MVAFTRAGTAATQLFELIDRKSEINPMDESGHRPAKVIGSIDFQGITFRYPTRPDTTVLQDLTLSVPSGKVTALVVSF